MGRKNPHNFKPVWMVPKRIEPIPNSPLMIIALAENAGQYYVAAVDPDTYMNYTLYANIAFANSGSKLPTNFSEIEDDEEKRAVDSYFLALGVFETYYKCSNWDLPVEPVEAKDPGSRQGTYYDVQTKSIKTGPNRYEKAGLVKIPEFLKRILRDNS